jgi:hypothetical protein
MLFDEESQRFQQLNRRLPKSQVQQIVDVQAAMPMA